MSKIISALGGILIAAIGILSMLLTRSNKKLKESEQENQQAKKSIKKYEQYKTDTKVINDLDRDAIIDELRKRGEYRE